MLELLSVSHLLLLQDRIISLYSSAELIIASCVELKPHNDLVKFQLTDRAELHNVETGELIAEHVRGLTWSSTHLYWYNRDGEYWYRDRWIAEATSNRIPLGWLDVQGTHIQVHTCDLVKPTFYLLGSIKQYVSDHPQRASQPWK